MPNMLSKAIRFKRRNSKKPAPIPETVVVEELPLVPAIPTKSTPAAQEVLSTPELLDLIFTYLPPSLLILSAKRICRAWYSVLSNPTPDLQVSLFLRPSTTDDSLPEYFIANDLLTTAFPYWLLSKRSLPRPGICSCSPNKCGQWSTATSVTLLPWKRNPNAWQRNEASWRNMLVLQPPITKLEFMKLTYCRNDDIPLRNKTCFVVDCPEGVTVGVLYDIVEGWIREAKERYYDSGYRERKMQNHGGPQVSPELLDVMYVDMGAWDRRELYLCDKLAGRYPWLFLHLDLDRYSLTQV